MEHDDKRVLSRCIEILGNVEPVGLIRVVHIGGERHNLRTGRIRLGRNALRQDYEKQYGR